MAIYSKRSDDMKRKMILEKRIMRLENLIKESELDSKTRPSCSRKSKNESALRPDMHDDLRTIFDDRFCGSDYFDTNSSFKNNMIAASQGDNDSLVDDAIMWMVDDFGYDEEELNGLRDEIADDLAQMSASLIHDSFGWYDDDWNDDDGFESRHRVHFNRKSESVRGLNSHRKPACRSRFCK